MSPKEAQSRVQSSLQGERSKTNGLPRSHQKRHYHSVHKVLLTLNFTFYILHFDSQVWRSVLDGTYVGRKRSSTITVLPRGLPNYEGWAGQLTIAACRPCEHSVDL